MNRIEKVQKVLRENRLEGLIVDAPIDLYYLTGQELSLGRLVIEPSGATLFVDGRYFEGCQKHVKCPVILTAGYGAESPFGTWWKLRGKRVGFDALWTRYSDFEGLEQLGAELVPLRGPVAEIREIKEDVEIEALKGAAALGSEGMDYVKTLLQEGVSEKEVAKELEIFWLKKGGDRLAFASHIAFGEGSSQPHYKVTSRKLKKGDVVLVDIGVVLHHYHSDMTRVFFFGEPSAEMKSIYAIVEGAFQAAIALCRCGTPIGEVDRAARGYIEEHGYGKCFTHSLGHGVGLEIHESPRLRSGDPDGKRLLAAGMVVTIEPGIYVPGLGGVRLEDTILITQKGSENLTRRSFDPNL